MHLNTEFMIKTFILTLKGIPTTIKIMLVSMVLATPFAFLLALSRIYKTKYIDNISSIYISFIRGTPMVLQILIIYSLLPSFLNFIFKLGNLSINVFDIPSIYYAYAVFTLNAIAVLSECFFSALITVDKGQFEAGIAIGLTPSKVYTRVVIPQALVSALPNICNISINIIKATSLAFLMSVQEITAIAKIEAAYGYNYTEAYLVIFVVYIILCSIIQLLFSLAEKNIGKYRDTNTNHKPLNIKKSSMERGNLLVRN